MLACEDCGLPYKDFPLDTTIPDEQWAEIHRGDGGVLCANCMVKRASKLPGIIAARMFFERSYKMTLSKKTIELAIDALRVRRDNLALEYLRTGRSLEKVRELDGYDAARTELKAELKSLDECKQK